MNILAILKLAKRFEKLAAMVGKDYILQKPDGTLIVDNVILDRDDLNAMQSWKDLVDMGVSKGVVGQIARDYGGHPRNVDVWLEHNSKPFSQDEQHDSLTNDVELALDQVDKTDDGGGGVSKNFELNLPRSWGGRTPKPMTNMTWNLYNGPYYEGAERGIYIGVYKGENDYSGYGAWFYRALYWESWVADDDDVVGAIIKKLKEFPKDFSYGD
jgi:hypothetical protein